MKKLFMFMAAVMMTINVAQATPAEDWVMSHHFKYHGVQYEPKPNGNLDFTISSEDGTNNFGNYSFPYHALIITSKNSKPLTITAIAINRGQCHGRISSASNLDNVQFGQSIKAFVDKDCNVVEIDIITLKNGFQVYTAQ